MRIGVRSMPAALVILLFCMVPAAFAQSSIAGTVTDASGGRLPGVTVEARSPALIEGVRSAISDGSGQYRIIDLRPGMYDVSFVLPGFTLVKREGIRLESNFTAQIDAQLQISGVQESVVVTGASPVVDVQTATRREVMTSDVVELLPTGRTYITIAKVMPALDGARDDVGGSNASDTIRGVRAYGGGGEALYVDGLLMVMGQGDGSGNLMHFNQGGVQEYVYQVNGMSAEAAHGGVQVNLVPKMGGNRFSVEGMAVRSGQGLEGKNATPEQLLDLDGVQPGLYNLYDYNVSLGGPLKRDKLWFFNSYRSWSSARRVGQVHDGIMGPVGEQIHDDINMGAHLLRLTTQLTSKNKATIYYERTPRQENLHTIADNNALRPEATARARPKLAYITQAKWTSTPTNRFLFDLGWMMNLRGHDGRYQDVVKTPAQRPPYGDIPKMDVLTGRFSGSTINEWYNPFHGWETRASASYVTGTHALKAGVALDGASFRAWASTRGADIVQHYRGGVPFRVDVLNTPLFTENNYSATGVFLQDTWTFRRLTLNPGIRFDKYVGSIPAQSMPAGRFFPARSFDAIDNLPNWSNTTFRVGGAFDLFGNAKTAVKASYGKYMAPAGVGFPQRYNPVATRGALSTAARLLGDLRTWTDTNGDDIAQESEIGPSTNPGFGTNVTTRPAPDLDRGYENLLSASVDHELVPNVGISVSYNQRIYKALSWIDNLTNVPADYQLLSAPDPRGNGQVLPVYQVLPGRVGPLNQLEKNSDQNTRTFRAIDANIRARLAGVFLTAGTSTGRSLSNTCQVENLNALRFCDQSLYDIPFLTTVKVTGSYALPWRTLEVSGVWSSLPGSERVINYTVARAQLPQLTTVASVLVRLNEPGSEYLPRLTTLDLALGWRTRVGDWSVRPRVELFNALNSNVILQETNQYPSHGTVRDILNPRLVRFGVQVTF